VISTADAHSEDDPEFAQWPPHCIAGTTGQHKAESTLLEKRVVVPNRDGDLPVEGALQIIVEKQTVDAFRAPNLARVIERLGGGRFVVYGVVTEICVLYAVRGLLKAGGHVVVVSDAVQTLQAEDAKRAFDEMCASGAVPARVAEICGG
jgi:nicotinamidase/pyrazinamidase